MDLSSSDPAAARDFYTKLFGWTTEEMNVTSGMTYTVVKVGGKGVGGMMSMPPQAPGMPPLDVLCYRHRRRCSRQERAATWGKDLDGTTGYPHRRPLLRDPGPARRGDFGHYVRKPVTASHWRRAMVAAISA